MSTHLQHLLQRRAFEPGIPAKEFSQQWTNPGDIFSILLIVGGDVIVRALAQLSGGILTPIAFSFGWVAFAVSVVVSAVGESKLMPQPDCQCKVINGSSGYIRDNTSWVIGRLVRDYEKWMGPEVKQHLESMIEDKRQELIRAGKAKPSDSAPKRVGLCVSFWRAGHNRVGEPGHDAPYYSGFIVALLQLVIAIVPLGVFGDWSTLSITGCGLVLSLATGSLPQWAREKWACRRIEPGKEKAVVLTKGNGSQHAIVILSRGGGLDFEDLASGSTNTATDTSASLFTRVTVIILAALWILLLIAATGIKRHTWFLIAVSGIGTLQNIYVAGVERNPAAFGAPLQYIETVGETKVMTTIQQVEQKYENIGRSMIDTFYPGKLRPTEEAKLEQIRLDWEVRNRRAAQTQP